MRRLLICILLLIIGATIPLYAQEEPATPDPQMEALLTQVAEQTERIDMLSDRADRTLDEASRALDAAFNVVGFFEMTSAAVGLVVPFLAVVAGLLGFRRLESAQSELREARERFERDVEQKQGELDNLRDVLLGSIDEQRTASSNASLALALLPLGERQYRAQDYAGALDTYNRALKLDHDNPIIHYRIGYVHTQSGELEEAEHFMTRSLELDPDFTPARAARGYIFRRQGDKMAAGVERDLTYNRSEENFLRALNDSPKLIDEDNESWWGALGGLYRRRGQIEQAITAYKNGTKVTPHSSYPFSNLALLSMQNGDRAEGLKAYERVEKLALGEVRAETDNYWAHADLVVSRLALGKYDVLRDTLDAALETAPVDSPYTLDSLIDTLTRLSATLTPEEQERSKPIIAYIATFKANREAAKESAAD